jgi:imidazolonepropionase
MMWDQLWLDVDLATMAEGGPAYGAVKDGAVGIANGRIVYAGPRSGLARAPESTATEVIEGGGRWVTPGLVDCHTHLVYGGSRANEFEMRLAGASYEELARAGGGILSTVRATREASLADLVASAQGRLEALMAEGVTTIEIKSGYGLEPDSELRMLRAARDLGRRHPVTVKTTFLGAHAVPPEYSDSADDYVDLVIREMLPMAAMEGLADAIDAFCETIGFTPNQTRRVLAAGKAAGLDVKLHAEQLSDQGGAALAAALGALSADHLEYVSEKGVRAMAAAGTVAVLLPGAFYVLREMQRPPVDLFRKHGVPMALSTDCNPGSSPVVSLLLMVNMGCLLFGLTVEEALAGVTRNAAKALGMGDSHGVLARGRVADFVLWDIDSPADLAYTIGANPCHQVVRAGKVVRGWGADP